MKLSICEQCGEPFDFTEYSLCNDCRYDHRFIKLRKDDESQDEKASKKISKVMKEFKAGTLHSGKKGPVVKSKAQGLAIALSEAGLSKKKRK
jgi:hypothetical protein